MEREPRTNPLTQYATYFAPNNRTLDSLCLGYSSSTCYNPQLLNDELSSPIGPSSSGILSSGTLPHHKESPASPWLGDPLQEFLELDDNIAITASQVQRNGVESSGTLYHQNEWSRRMTNGGTTSSNWNEHMRGHTATAHGTQVLPPVGRPSVNQSVEQQQFQQPLPSSSGEIGTTFPPASSGNGIPPKQRMRWTPQKHELFLKAVKELGGCSNATPKLVLNHMNCPDMTICHVKSHLQKYRAARRPEPPEGSSERLNSSQYETPSQESIQNIGITEALRLQMELQKQLHEQLERQRKLQLQIEENGRYIRAILEKQCQAENQQRSNLSSATVQCSDLASSASGIEAEDGHHTDTEINTIDKYDSEGSSRHVGNKTKMADSEASNYAKRTKCSPPGSDFSSVLCGPG